MDVKHDEIDRNNQEIYFIDLGKDVTLTKIFNNLQTSASVPFAYCHVRDNNNPGDEMKYTKMFERLSTEMLRAHYSQKTNEFVSPNTIKCVVLNSTMYTKDVNDYAKYNNATISIDNQKLSIVVNENNSVAFDNLKYALPMFEKSKISKETVMGNDMDIIYYNFLIKPSDFYILADIIMGNSEVEGIHGFSKKFIIDESNKSATKKKSTQLFYIFSSAQLLRFQIKSNINADLKYQFDENMIYTTVSFEVSDSMSREMLNQFVNDIDLLFTIYERYKTTIALEYKENIKSTAIKKSKYDMTTFEKLSPVDYNMLKASKTIKNPHSRICSKERTPQVVREYDPESHDTKNYKIGVFPSKVAAKDPFNQVVVDCSKNKKYPFYGTVDNYYNNTYLKKVPCCFQKEKGAVERDEKQQIFFKSNKLVALAKNVPELGSLVGETNSFFNWLVKSRIESDDKARLGMEFVRVGVPEGPNSFFQCVNYALNRKFYTDEQVNTMREVYSQRLDTLNLCRQEMNSLSDREISAVLSDQNAYIDPKMFIHLLEWENNCKIFLFSKNGLEVPTSTNVCLSTLKQSPLRVVLIYVRDDEEHCELIGLYNGRYGKLLEKDNFKEARKNMNLFTLNFEYGGQVETQIRAAFDGMISSFVFGQRSVFGDSKKQRIVREIIFKDVFKKDPDLQMIDLKGLTRSLIFKVVIESVSAFGDVDARNYVVVLNLISPIQPINVSAIRNVTELNNITEYGALFPTRDELDLILKSLVSSDVGLRRVSENASLDAIVYETDAISFSVKTNTRSGRSSELSVYIYNQRMQKYILEYFVWYYVQKVIGDDNEVLLGKYAGEDTEQAIIRSIDQFMKRYVVVVDDGETINTSLPSMTFGTANSMFTKNGKIRLNNSMVSSLVFNLRLKLRNAREKVFEEYWNQATITDYYSKPEYFDKRPYEAVFETTKSNLEIFVKPTVTSTRNLSIGTIPILKVPYFFSNDGEQLFLADNCDYRLVRGIASIIKIYIWNRNNGQYYNPSVSTKETLISEMVSKLNIPMTYVNDILPTRFRRYELLENERSVIVSTENYIVDFTNNEKRVVSLLGDYDHVKRCETCFRELSENEQMCC
jgi:hypothetical protein